ncbi:unnamed protein product [Alopecurus aequalis]
MAGGDDRLSELPDDLLRRILHFVPLKEAASTTLLSRPWRTQLWLSSGAVNLGTRIEDYDYNTERDAFFSRRDAFISAAVAALDAAKASVTRLTLHLDSDCRENVVANFLNHAVLRATNVVDVVLSHRAARRVEELKLVVTGCSCHKDDGEIFCYRVGIYKYTVALDTLPWETLRVLELTNCQGLYRQEGTAVVLPRLSSLRLRHCFQHIRSLQSIINAAPVLATVFLESVIVDTAKKEHYYHDIDPTRPFHRLRCPTVTLMVLERCKWEEMESGSDLFGYDQDRPPVTVDFDAPRLRRFSYKGLLRPFSFSPQPPELEQVDLHFFPDNDKRDKDPNRDLATFWRFARSFSSTKHMRLTVNHLEDIAVVSEERRVELLPAFYHLERLEVQGVHMPKGETDAVAIANLLHCCPVLRDLRINLTMEKDDNFKDFEKKFASDRDKSADGPDICGDFKPTLVVHEGDDDASDVFGLSRLCSVGCLARTVGLKFRFGKSDCLGVRIQQTKEELYNLMAAWKEEYTVKGSLSMQNTRLMSN